MADGQIPDAPGVHRDAVGGGRVVGGEREGIGVPGKERGEVIDAHAAELARSRRERAAERVRRVAERRDRDGVARADGAKRLVRGREPLALPVAPHGRRIARASVACQGGAGGA